MTVFVLTSEFDYEGESPVAVYGTLELAVQEAEAMAAENGWPECDAHQWMGRNTGGIEIIWGSSHFIIREEVVIRPGSFAGMQTETFIH